MISIVLIIPMAIQDKPPYDLKYPKIECQKKLHKKLKLQAVITMIVSKNSPRRRHYAHEEITVIQKPRKSGVVCSQSKKDTKERERRLTRSMQQT